MPRSPRRRVSPATAAGAAATSAAEQPRRVRENLPRPAGAPGASGPSAPAGRKRRGNPLSFLGRLQPRFAADIFAELRKVTWPTFVETRYLTMVVAIVAVAMGLFLGLIDLGFGWVIEKLFF